MICAARLAVLVVLIGTCSVGQERSAIPQTPTKLRTIEDLDTISSWKTKVPLLQPWPIAKHLSCNGRTGKGETYRALNGEWLNTMTFDVKMTDCDPRNTER